MHHGLSSSSHPCLKFTSSSPHGDLNMILSWSLHDIIIMDCHHFLCHHGFSSSSSSSSSSAPHHHISSSYHAWPSWFNNDAGVQAQGQSHQFQVCRHGKERQEKEKHEGTERVLGQHSAHFNLYIVGGLLVWMSNPLGYWGQLVPNGSKFLLQDGSSLAMDQNACNNGRKHVCVSLVQWSSSMCNNTFQDCMHTYTYIIYVYISSMI